MEELKDCNMPKSLGETKTPHNTDMNRRSFLRLAVLGSTAVLVPCDLLEALDAPAHPAAPGRPATAAFAAFHPLAPGAVRADGWLAAWLGKQAIGLGYHLPQTSWPFTTPYWQGEENNADSEAWWPWEQKAYWIDGATRLALVTGDERLLRAVHEPIDYTLAHARPDGYFGPDNFKDPVGNFHRWPHTLFIRGLAADADATHNDAIVEAVRKHYLADKANYGVPVRNITNVENMLWCYERTGDPRLLAMAETAWAEFAVLNGKDDGADLNAERVYADTPIDAHGVSYQEIAKQPAILYMYTGKPEYLKFALAAQQRVFDHHMLIDGIPSTSEFYKTTTSLDSHETCDISDHTWSWGYVLMATGDGLWADRVERACFNAGLGAIKKDWKGVQYFSCPNQFIATQTSDHNAMNLGHQMMSYQPNPGHATACCGGDVHRLYPNYVIRMWMRDPQGALAATLYGPCRVSTTVGRDQQPVEIVEATDYPFDEQIHFTINTAKPVEFPLILRIPAWCATPSLMLNGNAHPLPVAKNGFVTLARKFHPGDTVTLVLPMHTAVSHWPENSVGLEHGLLVYALPIKEKWSAVVEPRWSTSDFPSWDARPASPWNYGLALTAAPGSTASTDTPAAPVGESGHASSLDPDKLAAQVRFERKPMTPDPWVDPPVTLTISAQAIESWQFAKVVEKAIEVADNSNTLATAGKPDQPVRPGHERTPPLPPVDARHSTAPVEQLTLVPYGSTHLRLTIFPNLSGG
jgi:hypothetical protein